MLLNFRKIYFAIISTDSIIISYSLIFLVIFIGDKKIFELSSYEVLI